MKPAAEVAFPYRSMSEARRDRYEKLGGPEAAYRFLRQGYYAAATRRRWEKRKREKELVDDAAFRKEHAGRQGFSRLSAERR